MADSTFVNVAYHGLDLGSGLSLSEFGPTTAYLEHPTPLPVGTVIDLVSDDGLTIPATVVRVQEQVSGADHSPGMHVQVVLSGDAKSWWSERVSGDDPVIPEVYVEGAVSAPGIPGGDTLVDARRPVDADAESAAPNESESGEPAEQSEGRRETAVMDAESQEELRARTEKPSRRSTQIMSAQELAEITKHATDEQPKSDTDPGLGVGNGKPKKKKKRRTRKKKST